jgi:hypothetical protein
MYDYQAGACKYFPPNDVRISLDVDISLIVDREKQSKCLILLGFSFHLGIKVFGALIAQAYVGQRDTRWLMPLTVSDGYQGEEDSRHNIRRCRQSHGCSAFYFFAAPINVATQTIYSSASAAPSNASSNDS